jgi:hypothetical protein
MNASLRDNDRGQVPADRTRTPMMKSSPDRSLPDPDRLQHPRGFDALALFAALDARRVASGMSWRQAADDIWNQSAELNRRRRAHPISPSTLTGMATRGECTCQHALFFLRWLERTPESFIANPRYDPGATAQLPAAGPDRCLRWDLPALYVAVNARRLEQQLTWKELAARVHCSEHQLTGIRTARYAIGMKLAMRIVQWLERPASAFVYAAEW